MRPRTRQSKRLVILTVIVCLSGAALLAVQSLKFQAFHWGAARQRGMLGSLEVFQDPKGELRLIGLYQNETRPPGSHSYAAIDVSVDYTQPTDWSRRWALDYTLSVIRRGRSAGGGLADDVTKLPFTDAQFVAKHARFFHDDRLAQVAADLPCRTPTPLTAAPLGPSSTGLERTAVSYTGRLILRNIILVDATRAALGAVLAASTLAIAVQVFRTARARRRALCERCGYSLAGLQAGSPCPECGQPSQQATT